MTKEEHIEIHKKLHASLDQLVADFIGCSGEETRLPSKTTLMELMSWSHKQCTEPEMAWGEKYSDNAGE